MKTAELISQFFFCALPCEAKPLIEHFGLKKDMTIKPFPVYKNADYCLTVTGLGKSAMAAGVAYTLALIEKKQHPILLNVGIAGHKRHNLGEIFIADKISDADSGKNYYPQLVYASPCPTASLYTVAKANLHQYPQDFLYDMEASAFYETAVRFTSSELIQSLKVISDNETSSAQNFQAKQVSLWIRAGLATLEKLSTEMTRSAELINTVEPQFYKLALEKWHFSASERIKLRKVLSRREVLMNDIELDLNSPALRNSKDVLHCLDDELHAVDFTL